MVPSDTATAAPAAGQEHVREHTITVAAPPERVYGLVADVAGWPQIFRPTVHAEIPEDDGRAQLLRLWALAGDDVRSWTSRRELDPAARRIAFQQVVSAHPVAAMGGEWRIAPHGAGGSRVVLRHDFRAVDDDPDAVRLIDRAVDANSRAELDALRTAAELGDARDELCFTFHDTVHVTVPTGSTAADTAREVFTFLDRAEHWPERLPHVLRTTLAEPEPGLQHLDMDTRGADGTPHRTTSVRVCFPERGLLVYKQLHMPVALSGHTGRWTVAPDPELPDGRLTVTSAHTVTLDPEGVRQALGPQATPADARERVRQALSGNSSATLRYARQFAEQHSDQRGGRPLR